MSMMDNEDRPLIASEIMDALIARDVELDMWWHENEERIFAVPEGEGEGIVTWDVINGKRIE